MALNKNNFIRWTGSFTTFPYTITAVDDGPFLLPSGDDYLFCSPLANDTSTLPLDPYSFVIVGTSTPMSSPPVWDAVAQTLQVFRPINPAIATASVTYTIADYAGNVSNQADAIVNIPAVATRWDGYGPSYACLLDAFGQKTGYANYTQLILVNAGTGTPLSPTTIKTNIVSDPDYIGPVYDPITCVPTTGDICPLNIGNFTTRDTVNYIVVTQVSLTDGSGTVNYPVTINPGESITLNVPASAYTHIVLTYSVFGSPTSPPMASDYDWFFTTGGTSPILVGVLTTGGSFDYGATTLSFPAGATIYVN